MSITHSIALPNSDLPDVRRVHHRYNDISPGSWGAANCISGSAGTLGVASTPTCATQITSAGSNWLSVNVAAGTRVGSVHVYNRQDVQEYQSWLGSFELWQGASAGDHDPTTAVKCGEVSHAETTRFALAPRAGLACAPRVGSAWLIRLLFAGSSMPSKALMLVCMHFDWLHAF